jgi:hypothetical protein
VAHLVLQYLTRLYESEIFVEGIPYFHWKLIIDHVRVQWPKLWTKNSIRFSSFSSTISSSSTRSLRFPAFIHLQNYTGIHA